MKSMQRMAAAALLALVGVGASATVADAQTRCTTRTETSTSVWYSSDGTTTYVTTTRVITTCRQEAT